MNIRRIIILSKPLLLRSFSLSFTKYNNTIHILLQHVKKPDRVTLHFRTRFTYFSGWIRVLGFGSAQMQITGKYSMLYTEIQLI